MKNNKRICVYPGTFDPITNGHIDIIKRASRLFDKVVVSIGINNKKSPMFTLEERMDMIRQVTNDIEEVVISSFSGLVVEYCKEIHATAIIRGLRAVSDFENETQMALINQKLDNSVETVFLMPSEKNTYLSSSIVKEIAAFGGEISCFVPDYVLRKFQKGK